MTLELDRRERHESLKWLGLIVVITVIVWGTPWGFVLYPFTLLATWFHEMGHGLAGVLVGGEFQQLVILPDGSGYALTAAPMNMSATSRALISASGPLAPAIAGGMLIVASRWRVASRWALVALAGAMLLSTLLVVRGLTGWIMLPGLALLILALAVYAKTRHRQIGLQFLGLQACISTYTNLEYLFSRGGVLEGRLQASDTEQIAQALLLPFWFWGGVLTVIIAGIIAVSLWFAYRR